MYSTKQKEKEANRIRTLRSLNIIDSQPEKEFDELTKLAAFICDTPVAFISLIDQERQWLKSTIGIDIKDIKREDSFCTHTINNPNILNEVQNTSTHPLFKNNPFVKNEGVKFYAGTSLIYKNENAIGTLCVIDFKPRKLSEKQKNALQYLSNQVIKLFELRYKNDNLRNIENNLREKNTQLRHFAGVVSHDMKMPLSNIILTIDILKSKYRNLIDEKGFGYLNSLKQSAFKMSDYITNILAHYESDEITNQKTKENIDIHELLEDIIELLDVNDNCEINLPDHKIEIKCNKTAIEQILLNLISNSLKYNDKEKIVIDIDVYENEFYYFFNIKDNGIGIPQDKQKDIFKLFSTIAEKDRRGQKGNGIGLSTVKKLVNNLGGNINVKSKEGLYTIFSFSIEKCK